MKFQINEQTGTQEASFNGKLISISDKVLQNSNGKNYKVATVEFKDVNNETQRSTALVYEGNYSKGMEINESYLCTATVTDQGVIVRMSHLTGSGDRPTADMFGFNTVAESIPAIVK